MPQAEVDLLKEELGAALARAGKLSDFTGRMSIALDLAKVRAGMAAIGIA